MLLNGTPPKGASCVNDDGYWKRAAAEVYGVKNPTLRLAKVLYSHWKKKTKVYEEVMQVLTFYATIINDILQSN
jgi:hypothetical protein